MATYLIHKRAWTRSALAVPAAGISVADLMP